MLFLVCVAFICTKAPAEAAWPAILFLAFAYFAYWCFDCFYAKKCHKEALRCLTESACAAGGEIETVE